MLQPQVIPPPPKKYSVPRDHWFVDYGKLLDQRIKLLLLTIFVFSHFVLQFLCVRIDSFNRDKLQKNINSTIYRFYKLKKLHYRLVKRLRYSKNSLRSTQMAQCIDQLDKNGKVWGHTLSGLFPKPLDECGPACIERFLIDAVIYEIVF